MSKKMMMTPGVYIVEKDAFPNSVVEVATAVPATIGYTQKADDKGKSLKNVPWRIASMAEFESYFGGAPTSTFNVTEIGVPAPPPATPPTPAPIEAFSVGSRNYEVKPSQNLNQRFLLYYSMLLFFQNGGGPCYVVSVGSTDTDTIDGAALMAGIDQLLTEQEPTMVFIPDAVHLATEAECIQVQQALLVHCGCKMKSRFAILDIYGGYKDRQDPSGDCVTTFRSHLGINQPGYAAAYYPWLNTTIVGARDPGYKNVATADLKAVLTAEAAVKDDVITEIATLNKYTEDLLNQTLVATSPAFNRILTGIRKQMNLLPPAVLPPSGAMAGVYSMVDGISGVWKAPANIKLNSVASPAVDISDDQQADLNVDVQGKSINVIRSFTGEGILVGGARTLDGNSPDWRYISVRRTMIMLEQSIMRATKAYVFENNVSTTWVTIKNMIRAFLTSIWNRGGLVGAIPGDAFAVLCGLGETMTPDDIVEGILRVTVLVAVTHPGEFMEITFQQQMQKS